MKRKKNLITSVTRRNIIDELLGITYAYYGRLSEIDFLARLFKLKKLKPMYRMNESNAYDEIYRHTINNQDWDGNWFYFYPSFRLNFCKDELFLKFLCEIVHPEVRNNSNEINKMIVLFNKYLRADGYEIVEVDSISGNPIFAGQKLSIDKVPLKINTQSVIKFIQEFNECIDATKTKNFAESLNKLKSFFDKYSFQKEEVEKILKYITEYEVKKTNFSLVPIGMVSAMDSMMAETDYNHRLKLRDDIKTYIQIYFDFTFDTNSDEQFSLNETIEKIKKDPELFGQLFDFEKEIKENYKYKFRSNSKEEFFRICSELILYK